MAPTVGECTCTVRYITEVKEYVRYRLDDIPFTTARKINHTICNTCKGIVSPDTNKELLDDMNKNRQFLLEQDKMFRDDAGSMSIFCTECGNLINGHNDKNLDSCPKCFTFIPDMRDDAAQYNPPQPNKYWHEGLIYYLKYANLNDTMKIVPAVEKYTVYCNSDERVAVAIRQFIKPDNFFKLVSIS